MGDAISYRAVTQPERPVKTPTVIERNAVLTIDASKQKDLMGSPSYKAGPPEGKGDWCLIRLPSPL
jgi:hypothetical protein